MSVLGYDGFDHYDAAEAQAKGWSLPFPIAMSPGRYGGTGKAANWTAFSAAADNRYPLVLASNANPTIGFAWMFTVAVAEAPVMTVWDGGVAQATLTWNGLDNKFRVRAGAGVAGTLIATSVAQTVTTNAFHHLEWACAIAALGAVSLKVNAEVTASLTGSGNTIASGTARITHYGMPASLNVGGNCPMRYDDSYAIDSAGDMTSQGDLRVFCGSPAADGDHAEFTASPIGTHFDKVNGTSLASTSYLTAQAVGKKDTFAYSGVPSSSVIVAVQACVAAYKTDAGPRSIASIVRQGGVDNVGPNIALASSVQVCKTLMQNNPVTGVAWTAAQLNADQFGVSVTV